jgi:hypothetical protein
LAEEGVTNPLRHEPEPIADGMDPVEAYHWHAKL